MSRTHRIIYHLIYEILPYDKDILVDYIIDLDTHLVIKPKY